MHLLIIPLKLFRLIKLSLLIRLFNIIKCQIFIVHNKDNDKCTMYDRTLFWLMLGQLAIGFIMITSASMPVSQRLLNDPFFFAKRDGFYIILAFCLSMIILRLPMIFWQRHSNLMLIVSIVMLIAVLVVGIPVNGAARWISFGKFSIQPAEFTKLSLCCYISNYLIHKINEIRNNLYESLKLIRVTLVIAMLLLLQPDLGTVIVLSITTLAMLFLSGINLWHFIAIICISLSLVVLMIIIEPYRIHRIMSFWHPWEDPFGSGYQLTQSLMAIGRGEIWGQGLGNSVQKLEYLPEAYTDFIFSILGEELGYIGVALELFMISCIALRAMFIGQRALEINNCFSGFLACSIGVWYSLQTSINIGAAAGLLPTKGLTLPLISYGGSSLFIMLVAIMLLLRIDHETRIKKTQAFIRGSR